jgi:uncharacterized protein (TIGR02598 family)
MWKRRDAFSMVEVALALGVVAFALLSLLALLPLGVKSNQISAEETRAAFILTQLETDLRDTHPLLADGRSAQFKLPLPYQADADGNWSANASLLDKKLYTTGLDEAELPVALSSSPRPRYQVSVIYTLPAAGSSRPVKARLVVNWPAVNTSQAAALADPAQVSGYVEAFASFPMP